MNAQQILSLFTKCLEGVFSEVAPAYVTVASWMRSKVYNPLRGCGRKEEMSLWGALTLSTLLSALP